MRDNPGIPAAASANAVNVPPPGHIRLGPFMGVPAVLRELGCDPRPVLRGVGLTPRSMGDPDMIVPFETIGRLLQACVKACSCPHFGLLAGRQVRTSALGVLGFTVQNAADVGGALANLIRYRELNDRGALITLDCDGPLARLQYSIINQAMPGSDQTLDCALSIGCNILRDLCGPGWAPREVLLAHPRPADCSPFATFFNCPVHFDAGCTAIHFDRRWLDTAPTGADPLLYRHMLREARELYDSVPTDAQGTLERLRTLLRGGVCKQEEVAALLGFNRRTLSRHLRAAGTTFRREIETTRFRRAEQLLAEDTLSATQIARALGYADTSAFTHAFKRWSGVSPGAWRRTRIPPRQIAVHG